MKKTKCNKQKDILNAAVKVFAQYGFHKSKMAKIAEVAGVSAGTLYNYFSDKDHMFNRIFEEFCLETSQGINLLMTRDDMIFLEKLDGVVDLIFDVLGPYPDLIKVFANEFEPLLRTGDVSFMDDYNRFREIFINLIEQGRREKIINGNIPAFIAFQFLMGGVKRIIYTMALEPEKYSLNFMRQNVKLMIKKGIVLNGE